MQLLQWVPGDMECHLLSAVYSSWTAKAQNLAKSAFPSDPVHVVSDYCRIQGRLKKDWLMSSMYSGAAWMCWRAD